MQKEIILSYFPKMTHKRYRNLSAAFSSWDEISLAGFDEIKKVGWNDENLIQQFLSWKKEVDVEKKRIALSLLNILFAVILCHCCIYIAQDEK